MSHQFGTLFRISSFGESHGPAMGVVIDGVPAGYFIDLKKVQAQVNRRRPGQSNFTSPRQEIDQVHCLSGLNEEQITLGSPLCFITYNQDKRPNDYHNLQNIYRPSHGDFTIEKKFGVRASSGGGAFSARETWARVVAGAIAAQILAKELGQRYRVIAYVDSVCNIHAKIDNESQLTQAQVDESPVHCPDPVASTKIQKLINDYKEQGDSLGGTVRALAQGLPVGLGEPVFNKFEALLGRAMLSIPACCGFEIGDGFATTTRLGSENNDAILGFRDGQLKTASNHSGGVQGGITNSQDVVWRCAFKPVSTIRKEQNTINKLGEPCVFKPTQGRHDPCVLPRAVPIVEAMAHLVILDLLMIQNCRQKGFAHHRNP